MDLDEALERACWASHEGRAVEKSRREVQAVLEELGSEERGKAGQSHRRPYAKSAPRSSEPELGGQDAREVGGNGAVDEPRGEEGYRRPRKQSVTTPDDLGRGAPRHSAPRPLEPLPWERNLL